MHALRIRRVFLVLVMLAPLAAVARGQSNTAEQLQRAVSLYEQNEWERSQVILTQVVSPQSPYVVTEPQRVTAYKYLGATLALSPSQRDSAVRYFRAALERDPFTDLDPRLFNAVVLQAFGRARQAIFAVGVAPVDPDTLDPRRDSVRFKAVTTHSAVMRVEIRQGGTVRRAVFSGDNSGAREILWDGLGDDGRALLPGRYELRLVGESRVLAPQRDSARIFFDLAWLHEPLEDSLAPLGAAELLPERYPGSTATADLLRGVAVAGGALLIQSVVASGDLGTDRAGPIVAAAGLTVGLGGYFYRNSRRSIPANMAENGRRRADLARRNAEIRRRNEAKLAQRRLAVGPALGLGL